MLKSRTILGISALLLAAIAAAFAVYRSSTYQECTTDKGKQTSYQQQYERYAPLVIHVDCLGPFAEKNHGPVTAVFTVILALSTVALWWSTRRLWGVTERMAAHIPTVERAWMFASPDSESARNEPGLLQFKLIIKNYGKTPGFLKVIWAKVGKDEPLAPVPKYEGETPIQVDVVLGAGEPLRFPKLFYAGTERYFYGYIRYTDIFDDIQVSRFCVRLIPEEGRFEIAGHPAWNAHYTETKRES